MLATPGPPSAEPACVGCPPFAAPDSMGDGSGGGGGRSLGSASLRHPWAGASASVPPPRSEPRSLGCLLAGPTSALAVGPSACAAAL